MSNEKAKEWIKSAREIQNFIAGTTSDNAQIGFITGVISRESESYADQETASLKERVRELEEVSSELLNHWDALHPIDRKTVRELYEKLRKLLTNNQPQKLKEGTGSENPTVQMHRDFQKKNRTMSNEKAKAWQKLTAKNLPDPNKLIWIKRKNDSIYLGYREDKPIATNADASKDCFWYANPSYSMLMADERQLRFRHNFSDVTVDSWAEVQKPTNMKSENASLKERVEELKFMIDNGLGWKDMENDNKPV